MAERNNDTGVMHLVNNSGRIQCRTRNALFAVPLDPFLTLPEGQRQCRACAKVAIKWVETRAKKNACGTGAVGLAVPA